jgi:hypothetical protein
MNIKGFLRIIFYLISVINAVSCIVLLCIICPRVENLGFDYMGVVVAILALLVTLLIGWNIWSMIDIKGIRKEFDDLHSDIQRQFNYLHNKTDYNTALMYGRTSQMIACALADIGKEDRKKDMLRSAITSVKMFANLSSEKEYNSILKTTLEAMKATEKIHLQESDIEKLLLMIGEIQQRESIPLLNDLVLAIRNCKKLGNG